MLSNNKITNLSANLQSKKRELQKCKEQISKILKSCINRFSTLENKLRKEEHEDTLSKKTKRAKSAAVVGNRIDRIYEGPETLESAKESWRVWSTERRVADVLLAKAKDPNEDQIYQILNFFEGTLELPEYKVRDFEQENADLQQELDKQKGIQNRRDQYCADLKKVDEMSENLTTAKDLEQEAQNLRQELERFIQKDLEDCSINASPKAGI